MNQYERTLDFQLLDQLEAAFVINVDAAENALQAIAFDQLGPGLAFCRRHHFRNHRGVTLEHLSGNAIVDAYLSLREVGAFERMASDPSWNPATVELTWLPPEDQDGSYRWDMFKNRLHKAAEAAGFQSHNAAALAGAFGEMASNAQAHSRCVETAIAGYAWKPGRFEYCITDLGVGVLESLTSCGHHNDVATHAEALDRAVQPGVSKYGRDQGYGFGFASVVRSLSRLYGEVRVHSGDHCIDITGDSPALSDRILRETYPWGGLLVHVSCDS